MTARAGQIWRTALFGVMAVTLVACGGRRAAEDAPVGSYVVADPPVPTAVLVSVPEDVALTDILARIERRDGRCYFYRRGEVIYPVTTMAMSLSGQEGEPYCD